MATKTKFKPKQKVAGGTKKRAISRAQELGMDVSKLKLGGVTGAEARTVRSKFLRSKDPGGQGRSDKHTFGPKENVKGGVRKRTVKRAEELGMNIKKLKQGGISGQEARNVRKKFMKDQRQGAGGKDIAGSPINKIIGSESKLEFRDQEKLLEKQINQSIGHTQTIGHAFDAYGQRMNQLQSQAAAATQQASAGYAQEAAGMAGVVGGLSGEAQGQLAARAQSLGLDASGVSSQIAGANQLAQAYQSGANVDRQRAIAQAGMGEVGDLTGRAAVGAREQIAALGRNRQETKDLEADRTELAGKKRDWRTARRGELLRESREQYVALLGLRQKAMSDEEDRQLRLKLGLIDARQARKERQLEARESRKDRRAEARENQRDRDQETRENAADRAAEARGGGGGGGGSGPSGKLTQSQKNEYNEKRNWYTSAANRLRKNLKKYNRTSSAWHATAEEIGGNLTKVQMNAIWAIAHGGAMGKPAKQFLNSEFPGGRSPWS